MLENQYIVLLAWAFAIFLPCSLIIYNQNLIHLFTTKLCGKRWCIIRAYSDWLLGQFRRFAVNHLCCG